jgi:hypothetical protein
METYSINPSVLRICFNAWVLLERPSAVAEAWLCQLFR